MILVMRTMNARKAVWHAAVVLCAFPILSQAAEIDPELLKKTVAAAEANVFPARDVKVIYEPLTEHIYISFTTPPDYKRDSADAYRRWRRNQWSVLQEFMLSRIPVQFVSVETNGIDSEGLIRYTHTQRHADKYADIHENRLWLKTASVTQKRRGSETWEKVE